MKTLLKTIAAISTFAVASVAMAASWGTSFDALHVTDKDFSNADWVKTVYVDANDVLSFDIFYHMTGGQGTNIIAKLDNIADQTYQAGDSITVRGTTMGDGLSDRSSTVQLVFNDTVTMQFRGTSDQRNTCASLLCGTDVSGSAVLHSGYNAGTIPDGEWGNVIASFKAVASTVTPPSSNNDAEVDTDSATSIDEDSARLNGDLDLNDWDDADVYFQWGTSSSNLNNDTTPVDQNSNGSFSRTISGLDDDRTYYFRAVAEDDNGDRVYGSVRNFRTDDDGGSSSNNEDVETNSASNIDEDSARLNGEWEGDDNTDVWFAFDEDDETPSCHDSSQREGETTVDDGEDFSEVVSGLDENEKYHFRACAEDSDGDIVSGSIRNFTTDEEDDDDKDSDDVDVTTDPASNVDEDSARLNGEMDGDDNVDVWFAFSRTDTTPSCNASSQRVGKTDADDGDDFSETVTNLQENEKYYFRACAEDNDGSIVSGSIRNFVTDEDDDEDNNNEDLRTVTNVASAITTSSARLNGIVIGEGEAQCYFQYGRTQSLGLTSPRVAVDLDNTSSCASTRTGLAANSLYYYRSVVTQGGETEYGSTRTFRTNASGVVTTPNNPRVTNTNTRVTIVNESRARSVEELEVTKWVSAENDPRFDTETEAMPGETVYYKVRIENNTDEDLEDVVVIDRIPFYLELDEDRGTDDDDDKQVRWVIDLDEGESRTFVTEMRVREDADRGDVIISYASAEHKDYSANSNDVEIEVERSDSDNTERGDNDNTTQAGFILGSGIFPTDLTGWAFLILIILAIAYFVSRIMAARDERARVLAELSAAKAAASHNG